MHGTEVRYRSDAAASRLDTRSAANGSTPLH
jgi:hypothetical protein